MAVTPSGNGYYLVASDGGIFTFGDAVFQGSTGGMKLNQPVVGMGLSPSGNGYQLVATDGGIFNFGDSIFRGSTGNIKLNLPVLGMGVRPAFTVKVDAFADDASQSSQWKTVSGDEVLQLVKNNNAGIGAGGRVYGVEGLDVSQLGSIGFTLESGPCGQFTQMALYYDADLNGTGESVKLFPCSAGGGGAAKTFDPVALGVPAGAHVTGLDILNDAQNTTVVVDDITVAGLTVGGTGLVRAA